MNGYDGPASTAAYVAVCAIVLIAPFELWRPLIHLPAQSISSVEAGVLAGAVLWAVSLARTREWPRWRSPLAWPWMALLAAIIVAALAAPAERLNAVHMVFRGAAAFGVSLLTLNAATTPDRRRRLLLYACAAGTVVAVLAILEYAQVGAVLRALRWFRPGVALVGAQVRAGGSLQYPTIASMYLEIVLAFGLGLLVFLLDARRRVEAAVCFAALVLMAEGIIVTYTRAGMLVLGVCLLFVGASRLRSRRAGDLVVPALAALLAISAGLFVWSRPAGSVWLRMTTEQETGWYRAAIDGPKTDLHLRTGERLAVRLSLTNTGRVVWDSDAVPPFHISYRWLTVDRDRMLASEGLRTVFPAAVRPGQTVTIQARVQAPPRPGRYSLQWDVVQEGIRWFSTEPGATVRRSDAVVSGPPITKTVATVPLPRVSSRPGRLRLWEAAGRMIAAHPLTGVGIDNFRLLYGPYAGLANADPRVHTNNMYLEVIVGGGLLAAVPLLWLLWRAGRAVAAAARSAPGAAGGEAIGIAAAAVAIGVHGLFDSFLSFTPTYVLMAVTLGLLAAGGGTAAVPASVAATGEADAHRV